MGLAGYGVHIRHRAKITPCRACLELARRGAVDTIPGPSPGALALSLGPHSAPTAPLPALEGGQVEYTVDHVVGVVHGACRGASDPTRTGPRVAGGLPRPKGACDAACAAMIRATAAARALGVPARPPYKMYVVVLLHRRSGTRATAYQMPTAHAPEAHTRCGSPYEAARGRTGAGEHFAVRRPPCGS